MDVFEEYLSLLQSLKNYLAPPFELNIEIPTLLHPSKDSCLQTLSPVSSKVEPFSPKKRVIKNTTGSSEPVHIPTIPSASDHPFHIAMRKALPNHIFYEYPPVGISPTTKLPSYDLPNVPLFFYEKNPDVEKFVTNLLSAIEDKFQISSTSIEAKEIEEGNLWRSVISMNHLKCVLVYDTWIATSPHGRCWYRTETNTNNCFLGTIPLIVLSSKADWYLDIENKKVVWNQLCRILKKPFRNTILK